MRCDALRELFSPYLDNELAPHEKEELTQHLGTCQACRNELEIWERLSLALRETRVPLAAPSGFEKQLADRIAGMRKPRFNWNGAKKWAAAVAAAAILSFGAASYANLGWWGNPESGIALVAPDEPSEPPAGEAASNFEQIPGKDISEQHQEGLPANQEEKPGLAVSAKTGVNDNHQKTVSPPDTAKPVSKPSGVQVAQGPSYEPATFLNKERKVFSTLLKVQVKDQTAAKKDALALAAGAGAKAEVFVEQGTGDQQQTLIRMTVAQDKAGNLLDRLSRLGIVSDRISETQDITTRFAETLEQYRALVAKADNTQNPEERAQLLSQATALEKQLTAWETQSQQQIIVLWLKY